MIKYILITVVTLAAIFNHNLRADSRSPYILKVGAVIPLTGDIAWFGESVSIGMRLALKDGADQSIKLQLEDDQSNSKVATINSATKLVNDGASVLLVSSVNTAFATAAISEREKIPTFVLIDSNQSIPKINAYTYGFGFSNERVGRDIANFAIKKLGSKEVGIVSAHDEWSEIVSNVFNQEILNLGGKIKIHEKILLDDNDMRAVVLRLKKAAIDTVYFPLYKSSVVSFVKAIRAANLPIKLLTAEGLSEVEISELGKDANEIYLTNAWLEDPGFAQKVYSFSGKSPGTLNLAHVAIGYDIINFLAAAYIDHLLLKIPLKQAISKLNFSGVLGPINFSEQQISDRSQNILSVESGRFKLVK